MYAGTQCHGMAIADPADDYMTWKNVTGPDPFSNTPSGEGLPTNLINDVLVAKDATVYVATSHGLAKSKDRGATWSYIRGRDWEAMVKGLYNGPMPEGKADPNGLLAEDYLTSLSEDAKGNLWIGYRQKGYEAYEAGTGKRLHQAGVKNGKFYTFKVLAAAGYPPLLGGYGEGLHAVEVVAEEAEQQPHGAKAGVGDNPPLPKNAEPPTVAELEEMKDRLESLKEPLPNPGEAFLGEDWMTQGDWVGRYGRQAAVLCAMLPPYDHYMGINDHLYSVVKQIGPKHAKGESLRSWMWKSKDDGDRRVLYNPLAGVRRPAGWDDHAEAYKWTDEGPNIQLSITIPAGIHCLSFYFVNYDGNRGSNRFRDFVVSVRENVGTGIGPEITRTRVNAYWEGVYKHFALRGPSTYLIEIKKNNSFNTMLSGVFFDRLKGNPTSLERYPMPWLGGVKYRCPAIEVSDDVTDLSKSICDLIHGVCDDDLNYTSRQQRLLSVYRKVVAEGGEDAQKINDCLRWMLRDWNASDRVVFLKMIINDAWNKQKMLTPAIRWSGRQ